MVITTSENNSSDIVTIEKYPQNDNDREKQIHLCETLIYISQMSGKYMTPKYTEWNVYRMKRTVGREVFADAKGQKILRDKIHNSC